MTLIYTLRKIPQSSPNFLEWKFSGKANFPYSFGRIAQNYAENPSFHKIFTPPIRYFTQGENPKFLINTGNKIVI